MKLGRALLASLLIQLVLYGYIVRWFYANRGEGWSILLLSDMLLFALLGLTNIGLFITYCVLGRRRKQPISPWMIILAAIVLIVTLTSPWAFSRAEGPQPVDPYKRATEIYQD
jgi:hypothetical protein